MDLGLRDKVALVTGGSRGIGRAIALALAEEGCHVAICAREGEDLWRTRAEIEQRAPAFAITCDATNDADVVCCVDKLVTSAGYRLDILVNNVGGGGRWGPAQFQGAPMDVWEQVWRKNMGAAISFTSRAVDYMRQDGWGRVVTISSIQGREGGGRPWHAAAKAAEIAMMKALSNDRELVRAGITFNTVAPGAVLTGGWIDLMTNSPGDFAIKGESTPMGRLGTPEEVAAAVVFLCSEQARWINGACLVVDGGEGKAF